MTEMTEPALDAGITRDIYPMPAFVTLEVADLERTVDWYVNGLDFVELFRMPGPHGRPSLVHLRRWRYQDILVRPGEAGPGTGAVLSLAALAEDLPRARRGRGPTAAGSSTARLIRRGTPATCDSSTPTATVSSTRPAGLRASGTNGSRQ